MMMFVWLQKCNPDSIFLDGMEGSTGAGPHIAAAKYWHSWNSCNQRS